MIKKLSNVAVCGLVMSAFFVGSSEAQVTASDAKCRASFQKVLAKYNSTVNKTIVGCWKGVLKGKSAPTTDCNDISIADSKGKVAKARTKLEDTIGGAKSKCDDAANATALAEFTTVGCPSPAAGAIANWADARNCAIAITDSQAEGIWRYTFDPSADDVATIIGNKTMGKCASSIQKNAGKLSDTAGKERGKAQAASDKIGGAYAFLNGNADPGGKIAGAASKLQAAIDKDCGPLDQAELAVLRSCHTQLEVLKECLTGPWERNGSGVTSMAYQQAGICPSQVLVAVDAGKGDGVQLNATSLSSGWTGLGHNVDISSGLKSAASLNCTDSTCGSCEPALICDPAIGNCRCSNDVTVVCTTPLGTDAACGGNDCITYLGPPLSLSASNSPVCAVNVVSSGLVSIIPADVGTGTSKTRIELATKVYTGVAQNTPCPICDTGSTNPQVGDAGTCSAGPRSGLACVVAATHPAFGGTAYECQPSIGANVTGAGLQLALELGNGTETLTQGTACTFAGGGSGLECACGVCTGGANLACNGDSDCPIGETCTTVGTGQDSQPNSCSDLTCTDGECLNGVGDDIVSYCDGYTRGDGGGILTCSSNADCTGLDAFCPNGNCGQCTLQSTRLCFTSGLPGETISVTGEAGTNGGVLASVTCIPPTNSASVNTASGIPGGSVVSQTVRFTGYCADGTTPWQFPGGANCQ